MIDFVPSWRPTERQAVDLAWNAWGFHLPQGGIHALHPTLQVELDRRQQRGEAPPGFVIVRNFPRPVITKNRQLMQTMQHLFVHMGYSYPKGAAADHILTLRAKNAYEAAKAVNWAHRSWFIDLEFEETPLSDAGLQAREPIVVGVARVGEESNFFNAINWVAEVDEVELLGGEADPHLSAVFAELMLEALNGALSDRMVERYELFTDDLDRESTEYLNEVGATHPLGTPGFLVLYEGALRHHRPYGPTDLDQLADELHTLHRTAPRDYSEKIVDYIERGAGFDDVLEFANWSMQMHGVQSIPFMYDEDYDESSHEEEFAWYLNSGDLYNATLAYLPREDRWLVTTQADLRDLWHQQRQQDTGDEQ